MLLKRGILSLIVLAVVFFLSGCTKTKVPEDDKTPPDWIWTIKHSKGGQEKFDPGKCNPKCPIVKQLPGETLNISFYAKDPEGVHEITLGSGSADGVAGQFACFQNGNGSGVNLVFSPTEEKVTFTDSGGYVETSHSLSRTVGLNAGVTCPNGFTFKEANVTLVGTAENYHQGKVTSKLTICVPECQVLGAP